MCLSKIIRHFDKIFICQYSNKQQISLKSEEIINYTRLTLRNKQEIHLFKRHCMLKAANRETETFTL